ncbi:MAG TPA: DNA primase [Ignavibacteria bacterium]|nr:DNA primase [Ignavibacteria bacterium]
MKIPSEKLDEIASLSDIVDIISNYIAVKKRGKSFLAVCPFHPDKNPSMSISQEKQVYHCFSCGASGNVFKFVQEYEKITFQEAAIKLAEKAGIKIHTSSLKPDVSNEITLQYEINKRAAKYFYQNLKTLTGKEKDFVYSFLKKRNISLRNVLEFGLGYARNSWDSLLNYFREENEFKPEDIEKAGLIKARDNDSNDSSPLTGYYDRFRGRLIFPVFNESGKVVAFGGRKLFEEDITAKFINSPESKIYVKSRNLYGLNFSKDFIRAANSVILVEGYMDFISLFKSGVKNVVASSGTALTEDQIKLISRYTKNIILIYDSDFAGIKAAKRGIELILEAGLDLGIVSLPDGEDPDSYINKFGKDKFESEVFNKKSVIEFIANIYEKENKLSSVNEKTAFIHEIITYIVKIPDNIKQTFYIKELAEKYKLYESDLLNELRTQKKSTKPLSKEYKAKEDISITQNKKQKNSDLIPALELELIELFLNADSDTLDFLFEKVNIGLLTNQYVLEIMKKFNDDYANEGIIDISKITNHFEDEKIISILTSCATEKFHLSSHEKDNKYGLLTNPSKLKTNYMKFARQIIRQFREKEIEMEIEMLSKENDIEKIIELRREKKKLQSELK